jgi:hypothetical protein
MDKAGIVIYIIMTILILVYNVVVKKRDTDFMIIFLGLSILCLVGLTAV